MPKSTKPRKSSSDGSVPSNFKGRRAKRRALRASTGFRSGYEAKVAGDLQTREIGFKYEADCFDYPFPIRGSRCVKCGSSATRTSHYTPDFKFDNGSYVEAKGRLTSANRTRLIAFKSARPDVTVRLLFERDNWLTGKHKKRYTDWAKDNGFESAVGTAVPTAWTWTKVERNHATP